MTTFDCSLAKVTITQYKEEFRDEAINLILDIQNNEAKVNLSVDDQPDLLDINKSYIRGGGNFWMALADGHVVGTIGLMRLDDKWCVLKKFFVRSDFRSRKLGVALYSELLHFAQSRGFRHIILDTPSVATKSHRFYERAGFRKINKADMPIPYHYPDRDSFLYQLDL